MIHIANTFVEWELSEDRQCSLQEAFYRHPIFLQLQFLPSLYASAADTLIVTEGIPQQSTSIESWGASQLIAKFAKQHGLHYDIPAWDVVKKVNSKAFSFTHSPQLPGATLLHNEKEARHWLTTCKGKKVLKTLFGVSGNGHMLLDDSYDWQKTSTFLKREWNLGNPVIAEPWVERIFDFSTQWFIEKNKDILYIGATICLNDENGQYCGTQAGEEELLFHKHCDHLQEHKSVAVKILKQMQELGYYGHVGFDAMIHENLHPVVEINARKTMGWVALVLQKRLFPNDIATMTYTTAKTGLLPTELTLANGKCVQFKRNLQIVCTINPFSR